MRENNKEKLFAQTFSLLLTRNIGDLTLDEVEKATGFTRGAIFYYAKTKLDFFRQVIISEVLEKQDIHQKVNYTEGMSLKDFIQAYLEGVVHTRTYYRTYYLDTVRGDLPENPTHAYLLLILQIKRYYPDLGERYYEIMQEEVALWKKVLTDAVASGEIGPQQGWFINKQRNYRFNPGRNYIPEIRNNFPIPIRLRESSCIDKKRVKEVPLSQSIIFYNKSSLLLLLLFNLTSLLLTFFIMYGFYPDNVFILKPTEYIDPVLLAAILNNVDYSSFNKLPQIGPQIKELKNKLSWVNDGVILVLDIYTADQYRKAEKGYDMILNNVAGAVEEKNSVYHIIAIISSYADIHIQKEKRCVLEFGDQKTNYTPTQYRNICRQIDDALINKVESDYNSFINIFKRQLIDVSNNIPESIPKSKRITYSMLLTTFRTYNKLLSLKKK